MSTLRIFIFIGSLVPSSSKQNGFNVSKIIVGASQYGSRRFSLHDVRAYSQPACASPMNSLKPILSSWKINMQPTKRMDCH